jgi:hypothetical protein
MRHNQRTYGTNGLHCRVSSSGSLANEVTVTAERQVLMAVIGHGKDLYTAVHENEYMLGRTSLDAQVHVRRIFMIPAQSHQGTLLIRSQQIPEPLVRSHPLHRRVTVRMPHMAASGISRPWF